MFLMADMNHCCLRQDFREYQFMRESPRHWYMFLCTANVHDRLLYRFVLCLEMRRHLTRPSPMPLDSFPDKSALGFYSLAFTESIARN